MIDLMLQILGGLVRRAPDRRAAVRVDGARGARVPVAFGGIPGIVIPQKIAKAANSFPLLAAPLFILMGNIMNSAGITDRIFAFAKAVRRLDARRALPRQHPRLA